MCKEFRVGRKCKEIQGTLVVICVAVLVLASGGMSTTGTYFLIFLEQLSQKRVRSSLPPRVVLSRVCEGRDLRPERQALHGQMEEVRTKLSTRADGRTRCRSRG